MNTTKIINSNGDTNALQVSHMGNIPNNGRFELGRCFLIKNVNDDDVELTVTLIGGETITTKFFNGWNPEIIKSIESCVEGLQYGY